LILNYHFVCNKPSTNRSSVFPFLFEDKSCQAKLQLLG
jgi:hypothetical protein